MQNSRLIPIGAGATYMLSVSIRVGFGTISLKSDSFKAETLAQALKENGVRSRDILPLFEAVKDGKKFSLVQAGTALSTMLDRLQSRYMICSGSKRWWFVAEGDMAAVNLGLEEMEQERVRLLGELQLIYDDARSLFHERLTNILIAANRIGEFEGYARKFPAWHEIQSEFRIEVDGPIKVPSLSELAKQEPDMQRWMQQIHQQMQRDLPKLIDDFCATAAEFLGRLEQVDPGNLTNTQANQLSKAVTRLESLIKLYGSITQDTDYDSPVRSLYRVLSSIQAYTHNLALTQEQLREYLQQDRQVIRDSELLNGASKGAKALYEWVFGASVEERVKALVQELKQFQSEASELSEAERDHTLQELKNKAESQALLMNHAAGNLLSLLSELGIANVNTTHRVGSLGNSQFQTTLQEMEPESSLPANSTDDPQAQAINADTADLEVLEAGF